MYGDFLGALPICLPGALAVGTTLVIEKIVARWRGRPLRPLRLASIFVPFAVGAGYVALFWDNRRGPYTMIGLLLAGVASIIAIGAGLMVGFAVRRLIKPRRELPERPTIA